MDEQQRNAIAADWNVDPELLEFVDWHLEPSTGNDDQLFGYYVQFSDSADPEILRMLGVTPGELYRPVSISAFDSPEDWNERADLTVEELVEWFFDNYEDPANRISYDGREGGYQWGGNGPYNARDELSEQFGVGVPAAVLDAAVNEIERSGIEWALKDQEEDDLTDENDDSLLDQNGEGLFVERTEQDIKEEIARHLSTVETAVEDLRNLAARGHNMPPELVDDIPIDLAVLDELSPSIFQVREQLSANRADIVVVQQQLSIFERVGAYLREHQNEIIIGVGITVATDLVKNSSAIIGALATAVQSVAGSIGDWINYLNPPF